MSCQALIEKPGPSMLTSRVRYFLAVWRERSFRRAALSCGVSQPSLTCGIRKLEEKLGGPLFQRSPQVILTDLGERVLPRMKRMERAAKEVALIASSGRLARAPRRTRVAKGDGSLRRPTPRLIIGGL